MVNTRREFTPEFKQQAVALLESSGRPQTQIAAELGARALPPRHHGGHWGHERLG